MNNPTKLVYLAGPITGCTFDGCTDWRNEAIRKLQTFGITGLSPMRAKDYLKNEKEITGCYENTVMSCQRGVTTRDRFDCMRCDVLIVNMLGAKKVSIGTVLEIAWADSKRTPIIYISEAEGNPHEHPMINEIYGFRVTSLDEAISVAARILA